VPTAVWALQRSGLFMSREVHDVHHADYAHNFALLTGWSNPAVNWLADHVMGPREPMWMAVLLGWSVGIPLALSRGRHPASQKHAAFPLLIR
jgi:hypothetical protein